MAAALPRQVTSTRLNRAAYSTKVYHSIIVETKYQDVENRKNMYKQITFNREEIHNAFNAEMIREISEAFQEIEEECKDTNTILEHPRCVVMTGKGRTFSAGADLNWMKAMVEYTMEENEADAGLLFDMMYGIRHCTIPVISRVNGAALGGGCGLVASSDIAVGLESCRFGFTEVKLGLIPAVIAPFVIAKIGDHKASRYFLTGEVFGSRISRRIGLLHDVVTSEEALDQVKDQVIGHICASSPAAIRAAKDLIIKTTSRNGKEEQKAYVCQEIAKIRVSELGQDGIRAFLHKTSPVWLK